MLLHADITSYGDTPLRSLCDTKDSLIQEILLGSSYGANGMTPSEFFAHHVLKDTFYRDGDELDHRTFELMDDECQPKTALMNHRGDGKTSRFGARILRGICLRLCPYVLYLQATFEDAATEMDNVKNEMMGNAFILEAFGKMNATEFNDVNKDFSKRAWFACNPRNASVKKEKRGEPFCFIHPRGTGQRVRGRNIYIFGKRVRPLWIFGDDLDDDENVLNQMTRDKNWNWWQNAVEKTPKQDVFPDPQTNRWIKPKGETALWQGPYRIFCAGTFLHELCMINRFCGLPDWKAVRHAIGTPIEELDGNIVYKSLRPKRISDEQLTRLAMNAKAARNLDGFYREMLCLAGSKEYQCWKIEMFQYTTPERDKELQDDPRIVRFVIVDPSKLAKQKADLTGIMAIAVDPYRAEIHIRRAVAEHLTTSQIPERALQIAVDTNSRIVAVEKIGAEGYVDTNFINSASQRNMQVQFIWLGVGHTPKGNYGTGDDSIKRWRAQQILPYYEEMNVYHHQDLAGSKMEGFFLDYDRPSDWGLIDCAGYIPAVMHEIGCVFHAQPKKHENVIRFKEYFSEEKMNRDIANRSWAAV